MKWRSIEGARGALEATVGKTVVRRITTLAEMPNAGGYQHWVGYGEFEAVEFSDGSWLAIEFVAEERWYSEMTPGSPAETHIHVYGEPA